MATILRMLAGGLPLVRRSLGEGGTETQILAEYPDLELADIRECLRFAAASASERELPLPRSA